MEERHNADGTLAAVETARPKVIYVMGAGRSGSTILGVALGNCEDVFFAGELNQWLTKSGVPSHAGQQQTRFWETVRERMGDPAELLGGRASSLERSSALLDVRKWPRRRRLRARYRRVSEDLCNVIAGVAGVTHVVDTSHYPLRARELQALGGIDLYLLLLVREPRSVVASLGRRDVVERRFGVLAANAYIWLTNLLSLAVFLRHPRARRIFVRHEDFLADPEAVIGQILHRFDSSSPVPELARLRTGTPIHGNRLIGADVVALEPARAGQIRGSRLTTVLQLPWTAIFTRLRPAISTRPAPEPGPAPEPAPTPTPSR